MTEECVESLEVSHANWLKALEVRRNVPAGISTLSKMCFELIIEKKTEVKFISSGLLLFQSVRLILYIVLNQDFFYPLKNKLQISSPNKRRSLLFLL